MDFRASVWPVLALLVGSVSAAAGQLLFKLGANRAETVMHFVNGRIAAGLLLYGLSTALWIWALSRVPLNAAYGFTALTFVLVYVGSAMILKEPFSPLTVIGLLLVVLGFVCLISGTR